MRRASVCIGASLLCGNTLLGCVSVSKRQPEAETQAPLVDATKVATADAEASTPIVVPDRSASPQVANDMLRRAEDGPRILLRHAQVIDGRGGSIRADTDIRIHDGKIVELGTSLPVNGERELDLTGYTVLPGFIDAHVHMASDPTPTYAEGVARKVMAEDVDLVFLALVNARKTLMAGFTTVREVGGGAPSRALRDAIARGDAPGPRMLVAYHSIGITGGHCDRGNHMREDLFHEPEDFRVGVADGQEEARKAVRHQMKMGADVIKVCATGGVMSRGDASQSSQLTIDEMRVIVEEANRAGRKVAAHAHGVLGIMEATEAGVQSIEHGSFLDERAARLMKKKNVTLVPTLYVGQWVAQRAREGRLAPDVANKALEIAPKMQKSFQFALRSGVDIALGTDAGVFPHGENAREFEVLVQYGMTPMQAIVAGTSSAARLLGIEDIGAIEAGMIADIVAVRGNPLENIQLLQRPAWVMKSGQRYMSNESSSDDTP